MDNGFKYEEQAPVCTEDGLAGVCSFSYPKFHVVASPRGILATFCEDSYPYLAKNGICKASGCKVGIPAHGVTGYKDVKADDEQSLMDAVSKQPVSVAIEARPCRWPSLNRWVLHRVVLPCFLCFECLWDNRQIRWPSSSTRAECSARPAAPSWTTACWSWATEPRTARTTGW